MEHQKERIEQRRLNLQGEAKLQRARISTIFLSDPIRVRLSHVLFIVELLEAFRHHSCEFLEIYDTVSILVVLVYHLLQICLGGILPKGTYHCSEFLNCDRPVSVLEKYLGKSVFNFVQSNLAIYAIWYTVFSTIVAPQQ